MPRYAWLCLLFAVVAAGCGGDDKGDSSSTAGEGGGGKAGKDSGGSSGHDGGGSGGKEDGGKGDGGGEGGSSGEGGTMPGKDASVLPDGAVITDAGDAAVMLDTNVFGACTTVDPSTDDITATLQGGTMPTAEGGMIDDGLYVLSSFDVYSPGVVDPKVLRRLVKVDGNDMTVVYFDGADGERDNVGTFTTNDSTLTFSIECPASLVVMLSYTATDTTFTLFDTSLFTVATYTKQ